MVKYRWALFCALIIVVFSFFLFSFSDSSKESNLFKALKFQNAVSPVIIPEYMQFAGENVPLNNFDTRESLERELIVNTYWHSQSLILLKRAKRYFPVIEPILKKYNIPDDFKYMAVAESGLAQVVSPSQAVGIWQLKEGTAKDYGLEVNETVDERYHIEKSTEAACKFMNKSYSLFNNWALAAASYNGGRRFIKEQMEQQKQSSYYDLLLGEETERYVFRMIALKLIFENPEDYGFVTGNEGYEPIPYNEKVISVSIDDFGQFALDNNTNYKMLKMLNPWLRKPYLKIPANKSYKIKIPEPGFRQINIPDTSLVIDTLILTDTIN